MTGLGTPGSGIQGPGWYRLQPIELAAGMVFGYDDPVGRHDPLHTTPPLRVLEDLLATALQRTPCGIAFSGGRDSSALLALAVDVAHRRGLPPPVPVTRRYAGDVAADESAWQRLVIRHLGITEWVRVVITDDCDLLGPHATSLLRRYGVLWPPTAHVLLPVLEAVAGGTLITGEGGDEVFGPRRATALRHLQAARAAAAPQSACCQAAWDHAASAHGRCAATRSRSDG